MIDDILVFPDGIGRPYLVRGNSGYLLIDTGLRNNYTKLLRFLNKSCVKPEEIEVVVITHADGDHFGCLSLLLHDFPTLVSAATKIESNAIAKGESSRPLSVKGIRKLLYTLISPLFASQPAIIKRIVQPGEVLPYLGGLEILDTIGHTPGHISLWSKTTRTLFCGDSIKFQGNRLSPSTGANTWDENLAKRAFDIQMELKPNRIYGGHGIWKRN
jgi:glyoxylase-like metal-dependent hydrolase (beta-lactamase superfamily II)